MRCRHHERAIPTADDLRNLFAKLLASTQSREGEHLRLLARALLTGTTLNPLSLAVMTWEKSAGSLLWMDGVAYPVWSEQLGRTDARGVILANSVRTDLTHQGLVDTPEFRNLLAKLMATLDSV